VSVWELLRALGAAAVAVAAAAAAGRWLGRWARGQGGGAVRLVGGVSLGGGRAVWLVRVGRRVLVVGSGERGLLLLDRITDPEEVAELAPTEHGTRPAPGWAWPWEGGGPRG
jgi:flagellar biogenesis protein FliO